MNLQITILFTLASFLAFSAGFFIGAINEQRHLRRELRNNRRTRIQRSINAPDRPVIDLRTEDLLS